MEGAVFGYWIYTVAMAMCLFQLRVAWAKGCCVTAIWLTSAMVWTDYGMPDVAAILLSGLLAFGLLWIAGRYQRRKDEEEAARKRQRRKTSAGRKRQPAGVTEQGRPQPTTEALCTGKASQ